MSPKSAYSKEKTRSMLVRHVFESCCHVILNALSSFTATAVPNVFPLTVRVHEEKCA